MKTPKSSDSEEVTPSKKVLKQARLPFKLLSEVSPKSVTPPSRKRKLSIPDPEPVSKIGKIVNDKEVCAETVVISDDDSKESVQNLKAAKSLNPLVKLVDIARKKKLQKSKNSKKKRSSPKKSVNGSLENHENGNNENTDKIEKEEAMDVDVEIETESKNQDEDNVSSNHDVTEDKDVDTTGIDEDSDKTSNEIEDNELSTSKDDQISVQTNNDASIQELTSGKKSKVSVTPKRSVRNKSKTDDNLNTSKISNCDESLSSPSTPRRSGRNISMNNSQGDTSITESANTSVTPKQLQKKLESAKKKEEREKEKLERERKRQQEKEDRIKQKLEKEEQRKKEREEKEEAKRKEREEKEEQRRKEKEEKEKQKELEKKLKEEKEEQKRKEKEEKEEQRKREKEAKEEEKRKRQEVLEQEKLEQEQKKKKAAEAFASFFVAKQKSEKDQVTIGPMRNNMLSSFTIKSDMRLAPIVRNQLQEDSKKELDTFLGNQNVPESSLYLKNLKERKPLSSGKTWPPCDKNDDDVMIVEDELPPADGIGEIISCEPVNQEKLRPKLLSFHENRRPPYWGTWRKKSSSINPRRPFKTDNKLLDYEVDSDEEWEEEQEGESIDGSAAGSDDEQEADEYEVDNEVFVPHGYLSDEEATMDEDDVLSLSPEAQKAKLKYLEDEFESEMKKPMEKLKPRLYGLLWEKPEGGKPENCAEALWNYISKFSMIIDPCPVLQPALEVEEPEKKKTKKKKNPEGENKSPKTDKKKKSKNDDKDQKNTKTEAKKTVTDPKKNQPGINYFLSKLKTS
ncbi:chromatin assembly factor 1 subunit A-B-like [Danaus plexippus]|uniref:chromatin assembly factor 1 subunit A-B-like n=1 Tax=Danaus plexippus TaxID=13037 RepID=UPI002AB321A4|nr:chromatin assembly factor 1 subunit A-B-like [Danaus plexippus]